LDLDGARGVICGEHERGEQALSDTAMIPVNPSTLFSLCLSFSNSNDDAALLLILIVLALVYH